MDKFRNYNVAFTGLKLGKHEFKFEVEQKFFDLFDAEQEFSQPKIVADVSLEKHSTFLDFEVKIFGTVVLICDITGEEFSHPIENNIKFLVKFGEEYDDSNEEVITILHSDSEFNISQPIYEAVILAIPMKKISPLVEEEDLELLDKYSPKMPEDNWETALDDKIEDDEIDPRWNILKNLKNKN